MLVFGSGACQSVARREGDAIAMDRSIVMGRECGMRHMLAIMSSAFGGELGRGEGTHPGGVGANERGGSPPRLPEGLQRSGGHQQPVLRGTDRLVVCSDRCGCSSAPAHEITAISTAGSVEGAAQLQQPAGVVVDGGAGSGRGAGSRVSSVTGEARVIRAPACSRAAGSTASANEEHHELSRPGRRRGELVDVSAQRTWRGPPGAPGAVALLGGPWTAAAAR